MIEEFAETGRRIEVPDHEVREGAPFPSESSITMEEAVDYWDRYYSETEEITNPHEEMVDGTVHYFDDKGSLYRIGDNLLPDCHYEMNQYKYHTDAEGRIVSAEGELHMKDREGRLIIKDSIEVIGKGDQLETDDRGHMIGDQFDGSNGMENMIPQDAEINRRDFKNFENDLAVKVKAGDEVRIKVEPLYDNESRRPTDVLVTYSINGIEDMRIFPNGGK